jgi:hypothetical protein
MSIQEAARHPASTDKEAFFILHEKYRCISINQLFGHGDQSRNSSHFAPSHGSSPFMKFVENGPAMSPIQATLDQQCSGQITDLLICSDIFHAG